MRDIGTRKAVPVLIVALLGPASARGQQRRRGDGGVPPAGAGRGRAAREAVQVAPGDPPAPAQAVMQERVLLQQRVLAQPVAIAQARADDRSPSRSRPGRGRAGRRGSAAARRVLARENFDRWIFGDEDDEESGCRRLEAMLADRIERAGRHNGLTASQREQAAPGRAGRPEAILRSRRREASRVRARAQET